MNQLLNWSFSIKIILENLKPSVQESQHHLTTQSHPSPLHISIWVAVVKKTPVTFSEGKAGTSCI